MQTYKFPVVASRSLAMTGNMSGFTGYVCKRKFEGIIVWVFFIEVFVYHSTDFTNIHVYFAWQQRQMFSCCVY